MLLNPSHEITNAGLPADVQDRYVRYKQGSRAIVAWMTKYGPDKYKGKKQLPIKQAIALGRLLCEKKEEIGTMPADIDYYFREVIKERAYLSTHFRNHRDQCEKDLIDTINHEHFTESMKQIHAILLTAGKPRERVKQHPTKPRQSRPRSSTSSVSGAQNSFSHLLLDDGNSDRSDEEALSDTDTDATSECSHTIETSPVCACDEDEINDDFLDTEGEVAVVVEGIMFIDKLRVIVDAIRTIWIKSGQGAEPIAAAAAYTNLLLARAQDAVREFSANEPELSTFYQLKQHLQAMACRCYDEPQGDAPERMEFLSALLNTEIESGSKGNRTVLSGKVSVPISQESLTSSLFRDLDVAVQDACPSTLTTDGIPCFDVISAHVQNSEDYALPFFGTVVVHVMSVSHCAYCSALSKPNLMAMPRISALKMANEALASISHFIDDKTIFPCQCINTLGFRVAQMRAELERFARYRCWNTLMQSPLTAGNHHIEILDLCSFYGMHLLHYRQYVAAVLHTYQALVQLEYIEKVPVLEEVCEVFAPVFYSTGVRPESGYMASWLRYIGARLKFKNGKKHQNHKDTWCMSVPAHAAARSAGLNIGGKNDEVKQLPKFDYATVDNVIKLKRENWILSTIESAAFDKGLQNRSNISLQLKGLPNKEQQSIGSTKSKRSKHKRSKSCQIASTTTDECCSLEHAIHSSFVQDETQGRMLPTSRLNLLALFHSMTRVVSGISDATHSDDSVKTSTSSNNGRGQLCLCFVQTILRGADRIQDVRKRRGLDVEGSVWTKNERECVECFKQHLDEVLRDAKVLDRDAGAWLWTSM